MNNSLTVIFGKTSSQMQQKIRDFIEKLPDVTSVETPHEFKTGGNGNSIEISDSACIVRISKSENYRDLLSRIQKIDGVERAYPGWP